MKLSFGCAELFSALNNAIKLADNSIDLSEEIINYLSEIIDEQTNEVASTSWDVDFYSYIRNLKKRMKRYIKKVLAAMKSSVLALKQRLFNIASRQSANAQYVDGLVASIPIPPTMVSVVYQNIVTL